MTDQSLPGKQTEALWSSGNPTIATSGATWTSGARWGRYESALAVGKYSNFGRVLPVSCAM